MQTHLQFCYFQDRVMYLILCYLFLPHQEIRISLNAIDALQPLHLAIYWGIITLSLTFSLDNKSNGTHQEPPLSTGFQFSSVARLCSTLCSPVDHLSDYERQRNTLRIFWPLDPACNQESSDRYTQSFLKEILYSLSFFPPLSHWFHLPVLK